MPRSKRMKCPFCGALLSEPSRLVTHIEGKHSESVPPDVPVAQFVYTLRTGKEHGNCVMCHQPTGWNPATGKFKRFCDDPKCKEKYRKTFEKRMIGVHGKVHLLNDPAKQREMLQHRRISSKYMWRDHIHEFPYTGTYEYDLLRFLDQCLEFDAEDLMAPSPHTYYYMYDGERHFYIPDFFIPSLGLEIEVKTHENMHHKIQAVDNEKERLKDEVMRSNQNTFDYVKVVDKKYDVLLGYFLRAKERALSDGETKKIFLI